MVKVPTLDPFVFRVMIWHGLKPSVSSHNGSGWRSSVLFISAGEQDSLSQLSTSLYAMEGGAALRKLAVVLHLVGGMKLGSPTTAGLELGGTFVANSLLSAASALDVAAGLLSVSS